MKKGKKTRWLCKTAGMSVLLGAAFLGSNSGLLIWNPEVLTVLAESETGGSLSSVTEEAKILPIPNSDGKYMLKSDGFLQHFFWTDIAVKKRKKMKPGF